MTPTVEMFFISYASEDRPRVKPVWERLRQEFKDVHFWFDEQELLPGLDWDLEIQKAKDKAIGMVLFLSNTSLEKEGYVQREFKWAMRRMEEMPEGHTFLFPAKLERCELPYQMRQWQACNLFDGEAGYQRLKLALLARLQQVGARKPSGPGGPPSTPGRTALLATEKFPLPVLEDEYRACTSRSFKRNSGSLPTYELALEHGAAMLLPVDPADVQYTRLDRQIRLFQPDALVVLGMGCSQAGISTPTGRRLVIPAQIHPYEVQEVTRDRSRDYELSAGSPPFTPGPRALGLDPASHHKVGVLSRRMDPALLKRQIAQTDLDVIELEQARLFQLVSTYARDWALLSAITGPLGSGPQWTNSAAQAISKKVMQMLGLAK